MSSINGFTEKKHQKIITITTRHLAPPWIILSHPEPTPIICGLIFLCSECWSLTLPSISLGWVLLLPGWGLTIASPFVIAFSGVLKTSFHWPQGFLGMFAIQISLYRSCLICAEDRVCIWFNYLFHYLLFPGWTENYKIYDLSGSPITDTFLVLNFCLYIMATMLISLNKIHQLLLRGCRNAHTPFWHESVINCVTWLWAHLL